MPLPVVFLCLLLAGFPARAEPPRPDAGALARPCAGCHGTDGRSHSGIPSINGLPEAEFITRMQAFKDGSAPASLMDRIARGYDSGDFAALARYFSQR